MFSAWKFQYFVYVHRKHMHIYIFLCTTSAWKFQYFVYVDEDGNSNYFNIAYENDFNQAFLRKNSFSFHRKILCMYIRTYVYYLLRESLLRLHVELQEEENLMVPRICNMETGIIYIPFQVVYVN